ncbi:MAG: alpha/beta fold hydrolase [Chloroflexota bacterium]|nr:alpha/beta fold hydrolase [Chloroflexota bacterium]
MNTRSLRRALVGCLLLPAALFLARAYLQVRKWLYPQSPAIEPQPAESPFCRVCFKSEDGLTIRAWHAPPASRGGSVLLLHGHGGNRDQLLVHAEYLVEAGYGALLIDFRNHGESDGEVTSMGYHEVKDARAAYRFLQDQKEVERIALWGHSMGGAVASQLMSEVNAAGLIVDATFTDFPSVVRRGVIARGLPGSPITEILTALYGWLSASDASALRPLDQLARLDKRVLLFHGSDDPIIPLVDAERIAAANPLIRLSIFEDGAHSDLFELAPDRYRSETLAYLREAFAALDGE